MRFLSFFVFCLVNSKTLDTHSIYSVLKQYWGYAEFRPLQEDIILSVLDGRDTLALLPTGGGKSVCFQVPAMLQEGICIVVSPLIALMKDQVENLQARGIKAVAVYSGMSTREIDRILDNCAYGDTKFLYVSPERLATDVFRERVKRMKVNLLAVDEAHCISQWGYDFRPEYMQIAEIRQWIKGVPVLALTASATTQVVDDIQQRLGFVKKNLFRKSFQRTNLHYHVRYIEDKNGKLVEICRKLQGTGIVYVRNRKNTKQLAQLLQKNGVSADFYHAGLTNIEREAKQSSWKQNRTRVMVCTNAFGMGIDKPDVRFVVHYEIPDSPESYYQEAGRAGRDEQRAFGVLLYNKADKLQALTRLEQSIPDEATIKRVYAALGSFFNLAIGSGAFQSFDFDIAIFCARYKMPGPLVYNCLKVLEQEGLIRLSDAIHQPSRLLFRVNNVELYKFQVAHARYDPFIKMLLRIYGGTFDEYVRIHESDIAAKMKLSLDEVKAMLNHLQQNAVIDYVQQSDMPRLIYLSERLETNNVSLNRKLLRFRQEVNTGRVQTMVRYAEQTTLCRSRFLLTYFDEADTSNCGHCDVCIQSKQTTKHTEELVQSIQTVLMASPKTLHQLVKSVNLQEEQTLNMVQQAIEHGWIIQGNEGLLYWNTESVSFLP